MNKNALNEIVSQKYVFGLDDNTKDPRITGLLDALDIKGMKVLDSSTLDGFHTCELHKAGAIVTASDIRPSNLSKAMYRAFYQGIHGIDYRLIDLEEMHVAIKQDEFDLHFWSGSFYHLKDPVTVFKNISRLFKYTLLETHIAEIDRHIPLVERISYYPNKFIGMEDQRKKTYQGWEYNESGWIDPCSAKDDNKSLWLTRLSLCQLIDDCGLEIINQIYVDFPNPNGARDCYLLRSV